MKKLENLTLGEFRTPQGFMFSATWFAQITTLYYKEYESLEDLFLAKNHFHGIPFRMKKMFYLRFAIISLLPLSNLTAQSLSDEQTERLFKMSQLWGHATYFHPFLQYKRIPFDSAFAAAVPKVAAAKTSADLAAAINGWLSVLNDPITYAELTSPSREQKFKAEFQKRNNIGIVTLTGNLMDWRNALDQLEKVTDSLNDVRGAVLYFQNISEPLGWLLEYSGMESQLFAGPITTLGSRSIAYSGFVPETGSTYGGYQTYFKVFPHHTLTGKRNNNIPTVFIASSSILPDVVWAMCKEGLAALIAHGKLTDAQNALSYQIMDRVIVHLRTREPVGGSYQADLIMENATDTMLIESAMALIENKDFTKDKTPPEVLPALVNQKSEYPQGKYPSVGWRVLAAAKIYSVINYFFPNKQLMTVNWDSVTKSYLPRFIAAEDSAQYQFAVAEMYAHIQDGHGFNTIPITKLLMGGEEASPIVAGMVEGKLVVTAIVSDSLAKISGVEKGDVIVGVNGRDFSDKINDFKKHIAASNESSVMSGAARMMCRGADSTEGVFRIQKQNGKITDVKLPYSRKLTQDYRTKRSGRPDQQKLRFLTEEIGYADLNVLRAAEVDSMFEMFKNTKAIVFDMRGYPYGTAWTISPRLTNKSLVAAAKFTRLDRDNPLILGDNNDVSNYETWTTFIQYLPKRDKWQYKGKTVMLINESTVSQAEHTGLFFRAANGTRFIGSQTAGANGDVTNFTIPGEITMYFSGQTVWFPDGKQLQRVGLIPDIYVRPTIRGIRAGSDEVLERAIKFLQKGK